MILLILFFIFMYFSLFWLISGILAYGITFAYFSNIDKNPDLEDKRGTLVISIFMFVCGPAGLLLSFGLSEFAKFGIKFK